MNQYNPDHHDVAVIETTPVERSVQLPEEQMSTAMTASEAAAWSQMFELAQKYPRKIARCVDEAKSIATISKEAAESCFYALPRGGKLITGPSIRLAEIMQHTFGRLVVRARVVQTSYKTITVVGEAIDLERLVMASAEVTRRITDKHGNRYNDDMIGVTSNAAQSIAIRNAIFRIIPRPLVQEVERAARKVALGEAQTHEHRRQIAIAKLAKAGINERRVLHSLGRDSVMEITADDLLALSRAIEQAIKGEAELSNLFPDPDAPEPGSGKAKAAEAQKDLDAAPPATATNGGGAIPAPAISPAQVKRLHAIANERGKELGIQGDGIVTAVLADHGIGSAKDITVADYDGIIGIIQSYSDEAGASAAETE